MEEYRTIIGNNAWMYNPPVDINSYDHPVENATSAVWAVKEAEWRRKLTDLKTFNNVYTGAKDLINCEVAEYSVITIKQQYFGYGGVTPKQNGATHLQQDLHKYDDVRQKELKNGHNTP